MGNLNTKSKIFEKSAWNIGVATNNHAESLASLKKEYLYQNLEHKIEHLRRSNTKQRLTISTTPRNGNLKLFKCRDRKKHKQIRKASHEVRHLRGKAHCLGKNQKTCPNFSWEWKTKNEGNLNVMKIQDSHWYLSFSIFHFDSARRLYWDRFPSLDASSILKFL